MGDNLELGSGRASSIQVSTPVVFYNDSVNRDRKDYRFAILPSVIGRAISPMAVGREVAFHSRHLCFQIITRNVAFGGRDEYPSGNQERTDAEHSDYCQ